MLNLIKIFLLTFIFHFESKNSAQWYTVVCFGSSNVDNCRRRKSERFISLQCTRNFGERVLSVY